MSSTLGRARLFRIPDADRGDRVTFVELFFDLVFVFAITQLSHTMLKHLDPVGIAQTAIMLVAIWWVWMYTTWVTNWMNPQTGPIRWMLITLMLLGLVLSTSIPEAFAERSLWFAIAYVTMQVGRTAFVCWAYLGVNRGNARNLGRITLWFVASAPLWIVGAVLGGGAQLVLWAVAVVFELCGPTVRYWTPGLHASETSTWNVSGGHMAERCGLFIIIALGESILVTGTAFSDAPLTGTTIAAFVAAFTGTILLWLLYFSHGAEGGSRFIHDASEAGPIARLSYTYLHLPIVAGIVIVAVGDELVLKHPSGPIEFGAAATVSLGPALYLLGTLLFKRSVGSRWLRSHIAGILALFALFAVAVTFRADWFDTLALAWIANAVLFGVLLLEERGFAPRPDAEKTARRGADTREP